MCSVWKSNSVQFFALIWKNQNWNQFPVSHPLPKLDQVNKNWFPSVAGMQKDQLSWSELVHLEPVTTFQSQWESWWMKRDGVEWNWSDRAVNELYRFRSNYIVYRSRLFNASELSWIHLHSQHAFMALLLLSWASMNMLVNMWIPLTFYSLVLCCGLQHIWLFHARPLSKSIDFSSTC